MQLGIIIFIYFTYIGQVLNNQLKTEKKQYLKFVVTLVNHICVQEGWNSIKHLQLDNAYNNITIEKLFAQKINNENIMTVFNIVVCLLNYRYSEVIRNYVEFITLSIQECEKYATANLFRDFIDCTLNIEHGVKNSIIMFDKLYQVMTFLSHIDIKNYETPFVLVDEIYFAYHVTNAMKITDQSFYIDQDGNFIPKNATYVLSSIKTFIGRLYYIVKSNERNNHILDKLPEPINYQLIFEKQYLNLKSVNSNLRIIDCVLYMLNSFYKNTITNDYENLGFREIINPLLYKCDHLFYGPPCYFVPHEKGIVNMNIMIKEGNWKTLKHLYIEHNNKVLSVNRVLRDQANNINFHLKRQHFTLLLRCRFYNILQNFYSHLSKIFNICNLEKSNILIRYSPNRYIKCVSSFFMSIKNIEVFLNYLNTAMNKLKQALIWYENGAFYCISPIRNIVNNVLHWMTLKNLSRTEFCNSNNLKIVADNYMDDAKYMISSLQLVMKNGSLVYKKHCFYHENPFLSKKEILEMKKKNEKCINIVTLPNIYINYQEACDELDKLCKDFVNIEYENLGFDKIN
ncbi:uncharacterized protein LOC126908718 [Daktulosphaira vitifoliae]|uniref:uncharacterized protein LOC126908718 n=1 Tax=Daktulosphaira vitifoliae TaxID=58002 RepID=UPI0021AAF8C7|nr:uncharacterized protein LOC126908718 [Daktulosphaira vitifoliae]